MQLIFVIVVILGRRPFSSAPKKSVDGRRFVRILWPRPLDAF